jgi:ribosome recycling factor
MINNITKDAEDRMKKCIASAETAFSRVRTGRANPAILEGVRVSYYGSSTPLSQVANVGMEDARTLTVQPWEKNLIPEVEKAIINAGLGLNPSTAGMIIRVPMPPLTEQTRKDLIKVVKKEAEEARVSIRNIRRDANAALKDLLKNKSISEDDDKRAQDAIQKLTDRYIEQIEKLLSKKESDLMEV